MDQKKTGALIRVLRLERADPAGAGRAAGSQQPGRLQVGARTGVPGPLPAARPVPPAGRGSGRTALRRSPGTRQHRRKHETHSIFFVCPQCGDLITATGEAAVSCCGRRLEPLPVQKPDEAHSLQIHPVEDEWFITSGHPMEKGHCLSFFGPGHRRAGHRDEVLA